jgi:uncharacterized protein DUF4158
MSDPADLINVAVEHLIQQRFELPAFSTLDRLVMHVRHGVHQDLYARITASLGTAEMARLMHYPVKAPFPVREIGPVLTLLHACHVP